MSNRERWTVYPLLFLTLGIAVKDKIAGRWPTDTMVCKRWSSPTARAKRRS